MEKKVCMEELENIISSESEFLEDVEILSFCTGSCIALRCGVN